MQTCLIKISADGVSDISAHIERSLFNTARQYRESIDVYGSKASFEWPLVEGDPPVLHTAGKPESQIPENLDIPDYGEQLPHEICKYTQKSVDAQHLSFLQGGGHGGSHPHIVHAMLSALADGREPWPNAEQSANWTCVGICAHESAQRGGARVYLPEISRWVRFRNSLNLPMPSADVVYAGGVIAGTVSTIAALVTGAHGKLCLATPTWGATDNQRATIVPHSWASIAVHNGFALPVGLLAGCVFTAAGLLLWKIITCVAKSCLRGLQHICSW